MTNKFEQLIEFVINDEEQKARALFHDIVVEKSREIYENIMNEEESDSERDDKAERAGKKVAKDIEYDEKHDRTDEAFGGDAADDLIDDVEVEEEGMYEEDDADAEFDDEAEEAGEEETADIEDHHDDVGGNEELEDRVIDLEDKLDELMAEFESMMGDEDGEEVDAEFDMEPVDGEVGGDAFADDDTAEFEVDTEEEMMENVSLKAAPKPVTAEPSGTGKNSPNANNSGSRGAMAVPVKMVGDTAQGRPTPKAGDLIGKVQNTPGGDGSKQSAAPKPVTSQATGVNTKTPFPKV
jgi:hypothetical protein